ncbi:glycosyltransferase family 2 protein [Phyllobacterium endophyticum]|uniref:Glycosyltransferase n=1 Tax=Phyllobacterium endophyticum TaxID=1149773 RepID=A0A2P7ALK2_9HYPH|nr:glycosyltransferase family 2 protein [Phyllobacterium endophyticum]MBB3236371.1 undecaprenyl-phosphate 4-deoxy-4-formamido-L-arabinose transferase [Phyllobacterium endophyticum]PSH55094.1 glycosyltransferase [Phyllobacterium endophyticum]TYR39906.1 glycosyltransferase [Phyllobacterium endophyticum]
MPRTQRDQIDLSIVIPVYRSMAVLPELIAQLRQVLDNSSYHNRFEVVLANDCSPDQSWKVIKELSQQHSFVRGISLRKNVGQHNATMAGLSIARGKIIIIMDDDLQHPPAAILRLAQQIEDGFDVCYTRYRERKHVAWKRWGSRFNNWVATLMLKKPANLYLSSFKAMKREIATTILRYDGPYTYIDGLIVGATNSVTAIDIDHQERFSGEGNYNLRKSLSLWLKMATGSSIYPLRLATIAGFCLAAASFVFFLYVIIEWLLNPNVQPGWTSVIATVLFIGGVQTFCMGVIGEYIGRIYLRLNNTPQFVIGQTTFDDEAVGDPAPVRGPTKRSIARQ